MVQVMAGLAGEYDVVLVARSDGVLAADIRPLVRISVTVIAEQNGRREMGSSGGGGRYSYGYFSDEMLEKYATQAVDAAHRQPRCARRTGRPDDGGTGTGLARRAVA